MAQTLGDVLTLCRDQLQDTRQPYRHSTEKLYRYLNLALSDALSLRPDLFLPSAYAAEFAYTETDAATTVPIEFGYIVALVYYVVGTVSIEDDEFVANGRGAALLAQFKRKLTGTT